MIQEAVKPVDRTGDMRSRASGAPTITEVTGIPAAGAEGRYVTSMQTTAALRHGRIEQSRRTGLRRKPARRAPELAPSHWTRCGPTARS